jgi:uncharacterized coiled-coil protein SlyX
MEHMEHQTTGRLNQLEKEVSAMGNELHSQSRALGELSAIQSMQGARLDKVGDGVEKLLEQKANNHMFTPSIVLSLIAGVFVAFLSVSEYISLQLDPILESQQGITTRASEDRSRNNDAIENFQGFRAETHFEVATWKAFEEAQKLEHARALDRMDKLEERLNESEHSIASNSTAIASLEKDVDQIDNQGSRAWVGKDLAP